MGTEIKKQFRERILDHIARMVILRQSMLGLMDRSPPGDHGAILDICVLLEDAERKIIALIRKA